MKVALFTWDLSYGAFALGCGATAKGLQQLGIEEIDVLHLDRHQESKILPIFPPTVNFVRLPAYHSRQAPLAVAHYLKVSQPDILFSMPLNVNFGAIIGRRLAGPVKTKLLVGERAVTAYSEFIQRFPRLSQAALPIVKRLLYPQASGIVCNTQGIKDDLTQNVGLRMPDARFAVIAPAVDVTGVAQWKDEPVRHPWLDDKECPVIVTVARLSSEKNVALLIDAFGRVKSQFNCRLMILGEGTERAALQAMIEQKGLASSVAMLGHLENPWSYMARADLFVLTSIAESFGRVLVEAMVCGLPVISTDAIGGGPRMVLEDGHYGKLVPSGDGDALVETMLAILTKPALAQHLRDLGAQRASISEPAKVAKALLDFAETLES